MLHTRIRRRLLRFRGAGDGANAAAPPGPPPTGRRQRRNGRPVALLATASLLAGTGVAAMTTTGAHGATSDLSAFDAVDQFIGTQHDTTQNKGNSAYGNTWPGATVPFGMVQFTPTTHHTSGGDNWGGYEYGADQLRGFGLTRLSGTGCAGSNGAFDVPVLPYTGALTSNRALPISPADAIGDYYLDFSHDNETAEPGYYSVGLDNGVDVALTATTRTGVATFDFPRDRASSTLIFDVAGSNNGSTGSSVTVSGNTVSGWTETSTVCRGGSYRIHFSAEFDTEFDSSGTWSGSEVTAGAAEASATTSHGAGAFVSFPRGADVTARIGISYVSVENAAENAATETAGRDAADIRQAAADTWREALDTVEVTGGSAEARTSFYTALYHALLHPNTYDDVNGQYMGYDGTVREVAEGRHQYATYASWDGYRGHAQLVALLFPEVGSDINQSITDLVTQTGRWPNWPHNGVSQQKMSGDGLQTVLAATDAFGSTDYDRRAALRSMIDTQTLPADSSNRQFLYQYAGLGWVESRNNSSATSQTLEYAINDFSIAQLAARLGETGAHASFMARAQNWRNLLDPETREIRPRDRNGFDRSFNLGERGSQFEQATGHQYGWLVPHNVGALVEARGGADVVAGQLDTFFTELDAGVYNTPYAYLSNQPTMHTPWLYNWLGRPWRTTDVLDRAVTEMFDTSPTGLPGNDDLGSLSSWYVFANIGLYPAVYGTADLMVSSPMFEHVEIRSAGGDRSIVIDAPGARERRYIQSMSVDGTATTASWLPESFAREGGRIAFTMGATPGDWGTGAGDAPPSHAEGTDAYNNVGTTPEGAGNTGSLDASSNTLPRESLAEAGATPGGTLRVEATGTEFTWPDTEPGEPDNWVPHGQRVDVEDTNAASVSFLGLATNGPSQGTATVLYTDGSSQEVPVQLTDWTPGGTYLYGNTPVLTVPGRNAANGTRDNVRAVVLATAPVALDPSKTVDAVLLPEGSDRGVMHIFDIGLSDQAPPAPDETPERVVLTPADDPATAQHVTWRSLAGEGTAQIRAGQDGEIRTAEATAEAETVVGGDTATSWTATFTDLAPGTAYQYRVGREDAWSDWHGFTTAATEAEPFTFLYYGDAQVGLRDVWPGTVAQANEAHPDARAAVYVGDLVDTADEAQWSDWFAADPDALAARQSIVAVGNHEFNAGNGLLQTSRASFAFPANGPVPADAGEDADRWGEHLAEAMRESVYYADYQGVRFVVLNANRDDICALVRPDGMADFDCGEARGVWVRMQAVWLDRVLTDNPHRWSVVVQHQPVLSTGVGRDEPDIREAWVPVFQEHNVDLVLAGHDHTYGRGHMTEDETATPGLTTGPVYVVSNAGAKHYEIQPEDDNVWTRNGARQDARAQQTSTYQAITVDGDTLSYQSVITHKGDDRAAPGEIGDTLDSFTITEYDDGTKWVANAGVEVPPAPGEPGDPGDPGNPGGPGDPGDPDDSGGTSEGSGGSGGAGGSGSSGGSGDSGGSNGSGSSGGSGGSGGAGGSGSSGGSGDSGDSGDSGGSNGSGGSGSSGGSSGPGASGGAGGFGASGGSGGGFGADSGAGGSSSGTGLGADGALAGTGSQALSLLGLAAAVAAAGAALILWRRGHFGR
ncbi:GH92 family glycosyl hydrolase [Streptomyces marincola]|uniref:Alpha-mannosidase n=1 Tax=Streptomyces marincola TaxID=2878388 RepID=A0A1W7D4R6_9ACTN|nr:GH92 family glycosyl hydrolase [Streptomyces marincola]ARQ71994.1 alpha-mannosidase [Streptomyces marincola]